MANLNVRHRLAIVGAFSLCALSLCACTVVTERHLETTCRPVGDVGPSIVASYAGPDGARSMVVGVPQRSSTEAKRPVVCTTATTTITYQ